MTISPIAGKPTVKNTSVFHRPITGEELYRMTGIGPCELVRGEIVERMPTGYKHGDVEMTIGFFLKSYSRTHKAGSKVFGGETGVYTQRNPDSVRGFDVAYMSKERFQQIESTSYLDIAPELIVEVMSPDDSWSGIQEKLTEYFTIDVQVVWVVDPKLQQVHSFRALDDVEIYRLGNVLTCADLLPGFAMPLDEVFEDGVA